MLFNPLSGFFIRVLLAFSEDFCAVDAADKVKALHQLAGLFDRLCVFQNGVDRVESWIVNFMSKPFAVTHKGVRAFI